MGLKARRRGWGGGEGGGGAAEGAKGATGRGEECH